MSFRDEGWGAGTPCCMEGPHFSDEGCTRVCEEAVADRQGELNSL